MEKYRKRLACAGIMRRGIYWITCFMNARAGLMLIGAGSMIMSIRPGGAQTVEKPAIVETGSRSKMRYNGGVVTWQANSETVLAGYVIYYGSESNSFHKRIDVGNVIYQNVIFGDELRTYYDSVFVALTAYDRCGNESLPSEEVCGLFCRENGQLFCDINGDGFVDNVDLDIFYFRTRLGAAKGDMNSQEWYNEKADFDGNEMIDSMDLSYLLTNMGASK